MHVIEKLLRQMLSSIQILNANMHNTEKQYTQRKQSPQQILLELVRNVCLMQLDAKQLITSTNTTNLRQQHHARPDKYDNAITLAQIKIRRLQTSLDAQPNYNKQEIRVKSAHWSHRRPSWDAIRSSPLPLAAASSHNGGLPAAPAKEH